MCVSICMCGFPVRTERRGWVDGWMIRGMCDTFSVCVCVCGMWGWAFTCLCVKLVFQGSMAATFTVSHLSE